MKIGFKKVHPDAKLPVYAHEGDAGMDVYAVEDVKLKPGQATLVSTGLIADIPDGYSIQVYSRSGLALKNNITVWNGPGLCDSKYRGVIGVVLMYIPSLDRIEVRGKEVKAPSYHIQKGDKIAQLVLVPVTRCQPVEVNDINTNTDRGDKGFGSSGLRG